MCSQISASQTAVKRQNAKPPGVTLFIAVHNCTILQNAVPTIGALRYIFEQLLLCIYSILCVIFIGHTEPQQSGDRSWTVWGSNPEKNTRFLSFHKLNKDTGKHTSTYWTDTCFGGRWSGRGLMLTTPLHLASKIRRDAAVTLIPRHAFMVFWRDNGTVSYLYLQPYLTSKF